MIINAPLVALVLGFVLLHLAVLNEIPILSVNDTYVLPGSLVVDPNWNTFVSSLYIIPTKGLLYRYTTSPLAGFCVVQGAFKVATCVVPL